MTRHTRLFSAVALALGTLPAAGLVQAATDNPPTTPATLTANRYSTTGADVVWARSTDDKGAVRGYEVVRDGVSLGIRDALSVSEKGLVAGRTYSYSVAAVDSAGQRSAPIRVVLGTKGFSNAASAPGTPAPAVNPFTPVTPVAPAKPVVPAAPVAPSATLAAPTGLRAVAYSRTAGELSWARPAAPGLRYDVSRDGVLVKNTDGVGYYDKALVAGRNHRYDVVAIDPAGRRSAAASVTLQGQGGTSPAPTAPVSPTAPAAELSIDNAERVLVQVFDVLAGNAYNDVVYGFGGNLIGSQADFKFDSFRRNNQETRGNIACGARGSVAYVLGQSSNISTDKLTFDRCENFGPVTTTGSLDTSVATGRGDYIVSTGKNFRIDRPKAGVFFNGSASTSADATGTRTSGLTGTLTFPANNSLLGIMDASISRACGDGEIRRNGIAEYGALRRTSGNFTYIPPNVEAPVSNPTVAVKTTTGFSYEYVYNDGAQSSAPYTFEKGKMTVTARDGSKLDIDAGNGDKATYRLTVTANGRSVTSTRSIEPLMKPFRKAAYCGA